MWQLIAIAYVTTGLELALFTRASAVIKESIIISGIADGSNTVWIVTTFRVAVYFAYVVSWPISVPRIFLKKNAGLASHYVGEEKTMFGLFGKKKEPASVMDAFVQSMYGNSPPPKTANLDQAIQIAFDQLLSNRIDKQEISKVATDLYNGPMPYSTHDLAISVALHFFIQPERILLLDGAHMLASMKARQWFEEQSLNIRIFESLSNKLYELYSPARIRQLTNMRLKELGLSPLD